MRLGVLGLGLGLVLAGLAGCKDSGLPDRNLPVREARQRAYAYPAYERTAGNAPVAAAGRNWIRSLTEETIPEHLMVPVGAGAETQLFAVRGSREPYSRLYARVGDDRWAPYLRLD
jgi:hypothetical protein